MRGGRVKEGGSKGGEGRVTNVPRGCVLCWRHIRVPCPAVVDSNSTMMMRKKRMERRRGKKGREK